MEFDVWVPTAKVGGEVGPLIGEPRDESVKAPEPARGLSSASLYMLAAILALGAEFVDYRRMSQP